MIDLRQGDCLEIMKEIPDKSVDMILCDLPYGTTRNKWDSVIPLKNLWEQYNRIIKENGAVVLFSQFPFTITVAQSNIENFKYEWIWQKDNGTGFLNSKKMPLKIHENILVFYKKLPTYNPQMRTGYKPYIQKSGRGSSNYGEQIRVVTENNGTRHPIDIIEFKRDKEKLHPTQKPVELLEYLIKTYTNEGETVLDNCMGSGSCGVACVNTNRCFIGIELDKNYFKIAKERINGAINDGN
jgi:site-specific DNA-methyltransferase (adenine-specific)